MSIVRSAHPIAMRPDTAGDRPLLTALSLEAVAWTGEQRVTDLDPDIARYAEGSPDRRGDVEVVAQSAEGPVDAAWLRLLAGGRRLQQDR